MGDVNHIRDQRTKLKEEIRDLKQEIGELSVWLFFSRSAYYRLKRAPRTIRNRSMPV